jgi:hypothetical protein
MIVPSKLLIRKGTHLDSDVLNGIFFVESTAEWGHEILQKVSKVCVNNKWLDLVAKIYISNPFLCRCLMTSSALICGTVDWEHGGTQFSWGWGKITIIPPFFSSNLGSRIFVIYMRVSDQEWCAYDREWKKSDRERTERETHRKRWRGRESLKIGLDCDSM